jgi:hydroxypyruvate isomerase
VETWWPFAEQAPPRAELETFCVTLKDADVQLTCLNLDAGDVARGERGYLSHPDRDLRLAANLDAIKYLVGRTDCRVVNALYGNRVDDLPLDTQRELGLQRLARVVDTLAPLGVDVVVETLNSIDSPRYPLVDIADSAALVADVREMSGSDSIGLLVDVYHLAVMRADPVQAIQAYASVLKHVQYADYPGRGRPGSGQIDFAGIERVLDAVDYQAYVGLEFLPSDSDPLGLSHERLRDELFRRGTTDLAAGDA